MVAWPLGLFDCCGVSDGSAIAIITRPEIAKRFRDDYILVKGMGVVCSARQGLLQDDYDFNHFDENVNAARIAYGEAGITDPPKQIDHSMVHDCFTITELITYEDMGWCPRGTAKEHVENGFFDLDGGEIAVNVDGGLKSFGHPIGASGIRMIYEVYKQLQGKAGKRQRKSPELGAIHNIGGYPGSFTAAVGVFGKRD
jgi:acetyl-CoA C-acetyltransferase